MRKHEFMLVVLVSSLQHPVIHPAACLDACWPQITPVLFTLRFNYQGLEPLSTHPPFYWTSQTPQWNMDAMFSELLCSILSENQQRPSKVFLTIYNLVGSSF